MPWAIKWRSENKLDGKREHLVGTSWRDRPAYTYGGYTIAVFRTRREARQFNTDHYGYIRHRTDLKAEPHGWKVPQVVKVRVSVEEVE